MGFLVKNKDFPKFATIDLILVMSWSFIFDILFKSPLIILLLPAIILFSPLILLSLPVIDDLFPSRLLAVPLILLLSPIILLLSFINEFEAPSI